MNTEIKKLHYFNGNLSCETPYKNGLIHGVEKLFCPDGKLEFLIPYKNGEEHGIRFYFDSL
jgi:antitoxin component YwqK of YwqJK toxin-antitoxin module